MHRFMTAVVLLLALSSPGFSQNKSIDLHLTETIRNDTLGNQIRHLDAVSMESQNAKAIHMLGTWHTTFGIITIGLSSLTILGGIVVLASTDRRVDGIVYLIGGCIDLSIGIWEVRIGGNLKKFK